LIRLLCAGICNTDLELQRGYYQFSGIPGHEFVGEVVAADNSQLAGKRVVGEINLACRRCAWCRKGLGRHCPRRTVLGIVKHPGAFSEFLTLPEANLHVVPPSVPNEQAVFVEPLAAACEIMDQTRIPHGAIVAVLGDGKLGLLVTQVLRARGFTVNQFGHHKEKLRISERAGADTILVRDKLPAAEYDWVVEATGSDKGLGWAITMTKPRGTVIMKSTVHGTVSLDTAPVVVNEITMIGSRCGRFEPALALLSKNKVDVSDMISDRLPLSEGSSAFGRAARSGVIKVLLIPPGI
jgi:threonine dehydrogenase-like Zn-dependent dehydrogenase